MPLVSKIEYDSRIKDFKDISPDDVLILLRDVRSEISKLDINFEKANLKEVLKIIEIGEYKIEGDVTKIIDLSSAKSIIASYRNDSEGGCQSCIKLGVETIDAQDGTKGWYCEVSDPDYDEDSGDRPGVRYEGFSPKVNKHYDKPCKDWIPKFSSKLDKIVSKAD